MRFLVIETDRLRSIVSVQIWLIISVFSFEIVGTKLRLIPLK